VLHVHIGGSCACCTVYALSESSSVALRLSIHMRFHCTPRSFVVTRAFVFHFELAGVFFSSENSLHSNYMQSLMIDYPHPMGDCCRLSDQSFQL
jgi:hypothetical protein